MIKQARFMRHHLLATAACIAAGTLATPVFAQDNAAQDDAAPTERNVIVVTGSLIRSTPEDAALPVDVFGADELAETGVSSPLEFIKDLPSVGGVLGDSNQFNVASQGFQGNGSINLRALGAERTLVLLDSRRTISSAGDGFTDTNLIPFFALERVELLKDGAATTYGSDAIGGVVNFITRSRFDGIELAGDWEFIDGSDGNYTASIFGGTSFGALDIVGGFGWQHRSELPSTARDFTDVPYAINPSGFSTLGNPSTYGIVFLNPAGSPTPTSTVFQQDVGCTQLGGTQGNTAANNAGLPLCRFTFIPFDNITETEDRYQAFVRATIELDDSTTFRAQALWARTDLEELAYSPAFPPIQSPRGPGSVNAFTVSAANPFVADFLAQTGRNTDPRPIAALSILLGRPFGETGNPLDPGRGSGRGFASNEAFRIAAGIEHEFTQSFRVNLDYTYWQVDRTFTVPDFVGSRYQNALNGRGGPDCNPATGAGTCLFYNPFTNAGPGHPSRGLTNPFFIPGNENSEELLNHIIVQNGTVQSENAHIFDLVFSGETGIDLGGGPIAYAFGGQTRASEFTSRPFNDLSNLDINPCLVEGDRSCIGTLTEGAGPFIFLGGSRPSTAKQDVYALFAEVRVPIGETLELNGAIRFEDYGGGVGSTVNPKGSFRWEPLDWLVLRGSVGTTFRGPTANQVSPNSVTSLQGLTAAAGNFRGVVIAGNPNDLGPEDAFTYNIGFVVDYEPVTFSVDYWSIDLNGRITVTPGQAIASSVLTGAPTAPVNCSAPLAALITFQGGCVQGTTTGLDIASVFTQFVNGPGVNTNGLDFGLSIDVPISDDFDLRVGGNATWTLTYDFEDFVQNGVLFQAAYEAVGNANFERDPNTVSEWRANGFVALDYGNLNVNYTVNFIDGVFDDRCGTLEFCTSTPEFGGTNFARNVESYTQHDINFNYKLPFEFAEIQLQGGVENIFDSDPAAARLQIGYNPFIGNALGRIFRVGMRAKF